jgi:hypothetical protein
MQQPSIERMKEAYDKHRHLKNAAESIGMKWQTLYWHLKREGHPIQGDKERYGSESDRFAAKAEHEFAALVGNAANMNKAKYQSKYDFDINGLKVDIKASRLNLGHKLAKSRRWAFSLKRQEMLADFIVCMAYKDDVLFRLFLLPSEQVRYRSTVSIPENATSKWDDYEISTQDLKEFFEKTICG